jgi:glycerophosphoryl diester phosphodiesterase
MKDLSVLDLKVVAHRGFHNDEVKENTIEAFKLAIKKKLPIELDVHILKDKTIVVYHDRNLKRLYKKDVKVKDLDYKKLSKLTDNKVPKLEDVLNLIDGKVPVIIELKKDSKKFILETELVKLLDNYNGKFAVKSFNRKSINWFRKNRDNYVRGILIHNRPYKLFDKFKLIFNISVIKPDFLSVNYKLLDKKIMRNFRRRYHIMAWTIKSDDIYKEYRDKCDTLICENMPHLERKLK